MFKMFIFLISIISLLDLSVAQFVQNGQCDLNIPLVPNFNVTSFLGTWYVTKRFPNPVQNGDCSTLEFAEEGGNLTIYNRALKNNFLDEIRAPVSLQNGTAKFAIQLSNTSAPLDFWILPSATYAVNSLGYSCENIDATRRNVYIWQLSRTVPIGDLIEANMNQTLVSLLGITIDSVPSVNHSSNACHVLPDIPAGQPVVLPGQCNPNIKVVQQFNASAFTGVWHEIYSYASSNEIGTCRRAQYQLSGSVVEVINSEVVNQDLRVIRGNATVSSSDGSAKLDVTLEVIGILVRRELFVLDTDYTSYAVSYACENLANNQKRVTSWILSRSRQLSEAAQDAVNAVIRSELDLNDRFYVQTNQTDNGCFYLPEFVPSQPVVFPGQCDPNIKGIENFNVSGYLGLWHNIESYYTPSQTGSCSNARYSLKGDVVNVYNTQVVNQELDSITGSAVINSTDGSAKLLVSFPGAGNTTNVAEYLVLASDYDSYALVYSCSNINDNERRVTSFKLSRSKQLSANSSAAIENVIKQIPVLDDRYFVPINQTEEDCFYYPKPQPGVPVVFPGKCEDNISVVQNFSLEQFADVWYEIEAYPIKQLQRHCVNHNIVPSSNISFRVETSSVNNQFLDVFNSSGIASANVSAKLSINLRNANEQEIPFWILDTDYSNYALAYGCVNMPEDFRLIYSWKLSRNKQLSESNRTAIDNVMKSITVLESSYFEEIKQSNEGCFSLPEIPSGEPIILSGQCNPNISVVPDFNATAYLGNWRLIESYASQFQFGTCNRANYALGANNTVVVTNSEVVNQTLYTQIGSATVLSNGKLLVNFPNATRPLEYWVLDTDYMSYSLVYSCENIDPSRRRIWSWKLSRSRDLSSNAIEKINRIINDIDVLNNRYYEDMNHSDDGCFYYPDPDPTRPVVFPGQCDPNIKVVTNFNASAYMDLWHNIASYPTRFQNGTCNNAFYTLRNGTVDVFNTQVINQNLDTINGVARLASSDGSAKLIVNFPSPGGGYTESPYWVLDTDYKSYALVYSCINLNDESRQVTAWTLSRTKQLTADAAAAINRASSAVPVLDDKYYIERNQSEESCFYYPEPKPGVVVEFPGRCANIQGVLNFNMSLFQGVWHEIEAYPQEIYKSQCLKHEFSMISPNSSNIISSNIKEQELVVTSSSLSFASAQDSSGNLIISLVSGGQEIRIPFVVLSTDYISYAVAYSCVNLPNDFRRVFSWKLSRNKFLTPEANMAINNATENINVLQNRYYEKTNQTDKGCFYLPVPVPGEPLEFFGQCDENIPVVQNFSAADYLGNWRLIESYASQFQFGTCNRANYALGANNTVVVTNSEVVNQTLYTQIGSATVLSNGKLLVNFPNATRPLEYWVLDTDYTSYSLVYSCENINSSRRRVWSWKLSRSRNLSTNAVENIDRIVNSIDVLNKRYYEAMNHSDDGCFYYPDPDPTRPVVFPGQCDPNIKVVTNFNASAYMDLWHNIASYPTRFQNGTCNNAFYTLRNGTVDVFNTQVINQNLDTINGVARLASSDGSAKLIVNFPSPGGGYTESPYWVLDTDYKSYALVYSCINLNDESRQVTAWTLSRTKQLTADAAAAINRASSAVPVLDDKYYIERNQSEESCFYYPEPKPGVVVEFPGRCANIQGVLNFNMSLFQGVWHEIEAYPQEIYKSQCLKHEFSMISPNSSNIISSNIKEQELVVTSSSLSFASAQDSSGNLIISLVSGGQEIRIPFVVLSTDYKSYAVAYSCVNLPNDFRRVFSWKLSRNKFLTPEANVAINNATENINVLQNRYYEKTNQTDNGCFYLPPPVPGVPVEFFGQCDNSIAVVQNFNASEYMGRWLLIQSYPAPRQEGSCNDATYSLNLAGTEVNVYNTKVVNQELVTINGTAVPAANDSSAKFLVSFPGFNDAAPYWVLDTDYRSFALVYSCQNIPNNRRRVFSWKLSRTSELAPAASARIDQVMSQINVLDQRYFESVNRSDSSCFYYPAVGEESPIFRGRCDENILVEQNFNASAYLGTWYNIESYPVRFQFGSCPTANYEAGDVGVNVYNTEVIENRLSEIRGVAMLASIDGSAKLMVQFPISGTNGSTSSPYWVLSTDYTNYALVYSCVNIEPEHRRVSSWKLSRTRTLAPASSNQINSIMSSVPVLDQRYFLNRGHSDQDCFFYPDNNGGPVVQNGQCDNNLNIVNNFDIDAFAGPWFEISRYPSELQDGECVFNNFTVNNQAFQLSKSIVFNETQITLVGNATLPQNSRGVINVNLADGAGAVFSTTFQVLDVVYNDFALLHNCRNLNSTHKQVYSWKLSRSQNGLSTAAVERINQLVANTTELFEDYYDTTDQTVRGCFHYPVYDELPLSIELIGPCNSTIRAKTNFNVEGYLGKWYEIASYPQAFQNGECARAQYSAGNNVVNVLNTQVVNRTLDARTATAVVASNDGSGLLEVTFSFGPNVTNVVNYYVLETDYTSFSLVYSCQNLPNGNRRVSSWKLSRGKVLPSNAVPIIDNIISNTQGLTQEYYKSTSQSDEDCFYVPQVNKNEAPLFRGQCEVITGMQGFDVQKYLGWWHEIESYPTDSDVGDCISSDIRAVGNQYQITDTNIFNNSAQVNTSSVAISADGRIRKTLSNGLVVDIWVLDTDYEKYSLLYSCENANSEYKRVWSAKHSKSRQLTAAAQEAMSRIIARTETLEPQFYLPINQDDEACFHYPEQSGSQIILPGQCDLNIPVMQNFTPARYSGTWYQIEKYPQLFENGTCIGARYTLNENTGVVDVLNWQVWNGTLDTIAGNATVNSTDGSAKLIVNLPVRGRNDSDSDMVSMELYVLKTDYITYSLAYSCVNINQFQRAVGVWKISRTRSLPAAANLEINEYMNSRKELHQPYFEMVEQNDKCEEPNSSYLVKSSIIIMLICSLLHLLY